MGAMYFLFDILKLFVIIKYRYVYITVFELLLIGVI